MNKLTVFLTIVIMVLCFSLGTAIQGRAQDKGQSKSFAGVIPFVTSNDRVGFFDQNSGRVYMYDNSIAQCVFIGQIQALGQSIQTLNAKSETSNI